MSTTYQCDGCGTTTTERLPVGWMTVTPSGLLDRQRFRNVPIQSHFCGPCWRVAIATVHSRVLTAEMSQVRSDTVEIAVIEGSWEVATS